MKETVKQTIQRLIKEEVKSIKKEATGDINQEILSQNSTHYDNRLKANVKVFTGKIKMYDAKKNRIFTAEILDGPYKGKWTTVWELDLDML